MAFPPNSPVQPYPVVDLSALVTTAQQTNQLLTAILAALRAGVAVDPIPAVYTVAGLPATAANGQWAFASNGRLPGQGAGSGSGCPVFFNGATGTWFSYCSGALVTS